MREYIKWQLLMATVQEGQRALTRFTIQLRRKLKRTPRSEWGTIVSELVEEYKRKYRFSKDLLLSVARDVIRSMEEGN